MKKLLLLAVSSLLLAACSGNDPSFKEKQNAVSPEAATAVIDDALSDIPLPPSPPSVPNLPSPPVLDATDDPAGESDIDTSVACTMDAKACPDGSYVGRKPPNCDFEPCPGSPETAATESSELPVDSTITVEGEVPSTCPSDTKTCPDGSSVGREGSNCDFETCPEGDLLL